MIKRIYDSDARADLVAPNLWVIDNCYSDSTFDWLANIVDTTGNEFVSEALNKRLSLKKHTPDYQKLHDIGIQQTNGIGELVGQKLELMDTKFWLDLPQFGCQVHSDSKDLIVSYQVYIHTLGDPVIACRGAEFLHVDPPYQVDLKPNYGYLNYNIDLKEHWVYGGHGTRTSVMYHYRLA